MTVQFEDLGYFFQSSPDVPTVKNQGVLPVRIVGGQVKDRRNLHQLRKLKPAGGDFHNSTGPRTDSRLKNEFHAFGAVRRGYSGTTSPKAQLVKMHGI